MTPIEMTSAGVRLNLLIQPRASLTAVAGIQGDRIKIRLAAPPVDGAANTALLKYLARRLAVPVSSLQITSGLTGKRKTVVLQGLSPENVYQLLLGA